METEAGEAFIAKAMVLRDQLAVLVVIIVAFQVQFFLQRGSSKINPATGGGDEVILIGSFPNRISFL